METFGWTWDEMRSMPYEKYLEFKRIKGIENKEEKKETKKAENKAKNA